MRHFSSTLLVLAACLSGCGGAPTAPGAAGDRASAPDRAEPRPPAFGRAGALTPAPDRTSLTGKGPGGFYPLEVGTPRWYDGSTIRTSATGRTVSFWRRQRLLSYSEVLHGRTYFVEVTSTYEVGQVTDAVRLLRQDASGLFAQGPTIIRSPFPVGEEDRLLAYPLQRGASWVVSERPPLVADVQGMGMLGTPAGLFPAWRIRIRDARRLGDVTFVWYGREGLLGMKRRYQAEQPDSLGNLERITVEESERLAPTDFALP